MRKRISKRPTRCSAWRSRERPRSLWRSSPSDRPSSTPRRQSVVLRSRASATKSPRLMSTLDLCKRSLVWLDYDGALSRSMANDLATLGRQAPSGTFLGVTFTASFPITSPGRENELKRLKEEFPDFLADDTKSLALDGA